MTDTNIAEIVEEFADKFVAKTTDWRESGYTGEWFMPPQEPKPLIDWLTQTLTTLQATTREEIGEAIKRLIYERGDASEIACNDLLKYADLLTSKDEHG